MPEPWRIEGLVVVTGAARGVGRAVALRVAERGARVLVADLDEAEARRTASDLVARGHDAQPHQVDVADERSVDALAAAARDAGGLCAWVNNAGVNDMAPLTELGLETFERVLRVNLTGCFLGTRAAARMLARGGAIVNVSSVSARIALRDNAHYGATKGGIESFSRHAAIDLAPRGVRVNCVAPGSVRTDMTAERYVDPAVVRAREERIPLGRVAEPEDIAGPAAFLCSSESGYMTGQTVVVDGGWTAF